MEKTSHDSLSRAMLGKRDDLVAEVSSDSCFAPRPLT